MLTRIILLIVLGCGCVTAAIAQSTASDPSATLRQLLSMPAPTPRRADTPTDGPVKHERLANFFDKDKAPPDDAPIDDLVDYWDHWHYQQYRGDPRPTAVVRERLLQACEAAPEKLPDLLRLLPEGMDAVERVKKLYDAAQNKEPVDNGWLEQVREWLVLNSKYFLGELRVLASKAGDRKGHVDHEDALNALAQLDWSTAEPLLQSLAVGSEPITTALALTLLYRQALKTKDTEAEKEYRQRLVAVAADRNCLARARDTVIEVLSLTEWPGRDEWYLSLLSDETLREPSDDSTIFSPLTTMFDADPDKWIPVMTKLVESPNRNVQQSAASCLVLYAIDHPRRDVILPVLRWLSDPDWLDINGTERAWFMQKMDDVEIPESVPGLIWIVENEDGNARWAARTLAHYKDARAIPALKKALTQATDEDDREYILEGLVASGGFSKSEQLSAIETYADQISTVAGRAAVEPFVRADTPALPLAASTGRYLSMMKNPPAGLVQSVLSRAQFLQQTRPAISGALFAIADGWKSREANLDMLRRIGASSADSATIARALELQSVLSKSARTEVEGLVSENGVAKGVGIVLLADENVAGGALTVNDQVAQIALLACARLTQMSLPVSQVGALLNSKNELLATAAERYLLAEDSKEARQLLWAHHPNQAFITGWRENIPLIAGDNFDVMAKPEEKLRSELLKANGPAEIFALLGKQERPVYVLRVFADRAVCTSYTDDAFYAERTVTNDELARFKAFIASSELEDLGPQISPCHHECGVSEFLSLTKKQGRRVFAHVGFTNWMLVGFNFQELGKGKDLKTHYYLENELKGQEIVFADDGLKVRDVWQQGTDLRVFVEREETGEDLEQLSRTNDELNKEEDEAKRGEVRRREAARESARYSWRKLSNGTLGAITQRPETYSTFDYDSFDIDYHEFSWPHNEHFSEAVAGNAMILVGSGSDAGLWRKAPGQPAVQIGDGGFYEQPLVTPDGKWVIVARRETDMVKPHFLVRFDLQTAREYRINLPGSFEPVTWLSPLGKVLVRRVHDRYEQTKTEFSRKEAEFFLLNAATGETEVVAGEFAPLLESGKRFLQPTGKPDEFWAAIPDNRDETRVGRYNLKDFSFQPLLTVPHLRFDSLHMWVDESAGKLYVVYEGQLLRLPLRNAP